MPASVEAVVEAVVEATPDGTIVGWSPEAQQLYGFTAQEVLGRHVGTLLADGRSEALAARERLLAGEPEPCFPALGVTRDGRRLPVRIRLSLRHGEDGAVVGTTASVRLGTFEQPTAPVPDDGSSLPQACVDLHGRLLQVNDAMADLLGRPAEDLVGTDSLQLHLHDDRSGLTQALQRMASGADHYVRQDCMVRRADGALVEVVLTATLRSEDGREAAQVVAVSLEDVSALRRAEREVRSQAERFQSLVDTLPVAFFSFDADTVCTSSCGSALARLGLADGEMVGVRLSEAYAHVPDAITAMRAALDGQEVPLLSDVGGRAWETRYRPVRDECGRVVGGVGVSLDVTERTVAERAVRTDEARLAALLRHSSEVVLVVDRDARLLYVSPAVHAHFGYDDRALFWQDARAFDHPDDHALLTAAARRVLRAPGTVERFESRVRHADGSYRWTEHVMTNLLDDPDVGGMVVHLRDLSEQRRTELELEQRSLHDGLTGLPGRALLLDRAAQVLAGRRRSEDGVGLVLLDVAGLARINTCLGQDGGDEVLRTVADRLLEASRAGDSVSRLSGGTFAVLLPGLASAEDLRARASALVEAVGSRVRAGGTTVELTLSTGSASSPAADAGALLAAAEDALRRARTGGTSDVVSSGDADVEALARAVHGGELRLHLQPVLRLDGSVTGAEVLVRWHHPERGLLLPGEFIPLAERSGLVVPLGDQVLEGACRQLADWEARGLPLVLSVNLSPVQIVGDGFVERVAELLEASGALPERLVLEVTESALMDDEGAPDVLRALSALGVRIALDDFGTGYSSLTYLKRFPVDLIKIDRSFVAGLGRDADDEAIVASVVSLARAVGKKVVAEGVETAAQLEALRALGVDQAQGYLWATALPVGELEAWLVGRPLGTTCVAQEPAAAGRPARRRSQPADADVQRILQLHADGASLHTIAAALNVEERRTPSGRRWTTTTVARTISSLERTG